MPVQTDGEEKPDCRAVLIYRSRREFLFNDQVLKESPDVVFIQLIDRAIAKRQKLPHVSRVILEGAFGQVPKSDVVPHFFQCLLFCHNKTSPFFDLQLSLHFNFKEMF
jgi:hypothetical protein